jgi:hypothetical protein
MKENALLCLALLIAWPAIGFGQSESGFDVKAVAKDMEERIKACPRREIVSQIERKHNKKAWQKHGWGPPSDVFADVKPSDSILYPYTLTIEFRLSYTIGPERENKYEADRDRDLSQNTVTMVLSATSRYRNIYSVGKNGIRLKTREVFMQKLFDNVPGHWDERPSWPDACWDQIADK